MSEEIQGESQGTIAVIGMAGRFPGAPDLRKFWENLSAGVESISFFDDDELEGVPESVRNHPAYVKAQGVLEGIDLFDAAFFGLSPKEAGIADPQQRFFLECGWQALEDAGYDPDRVEGAVGVFAGSDPSSYLQGLRQDTKLCQDMGELQIMIGTAADHLATRLAYLLNLRGPSVTVQTACSTSLVAIHMACQNLLSFECDMALAGGCSILVPSKTGYIYEEGSALSPDGHCRAFDADAKGTAPGSGVGLVVLKRIEDALADGDHILGVIRASAYNNDGSGKIGYTAPSVDGQRRVVGEALSLAELEPEDISYIETHGTGTTLGDPIEFEALRQVYGESLPGGGKIPLGSVKTNIGHCNAAAGVAGLIKTLLCMRHGKLVPSLYFKTPNPQLEMARSPFYVNTELADWTASPKRAGLSSFGIGGTNAHVVIEEAPEPPPLEESEGPWLLTLSAKTKTALQRKKEDLQRFLEEFPATDPASFAFTLNTGRQGFHFRHSLVFRDLEEARANLAGEAATGASEEAPRVVFLFPGQGTGYADMGRALYQQEPLFREHVDACLSVLQPLLGVDLAEYLFCEKDDPRYRTLQEPRLWQPALFVVGYALAKMWMALGVEPDAMMGHSIGEYVAATVSGVFPLERALALVAERGKRTGELPGGAMMAVVRPEDEVVPLLSGKVSLAAVNGPKLSVVAGRDEEIAELEASLKKNKIHTIRLDASHAFHSEMVAPLMEPIRQCVASFKPGKPKIPFISNVTGTWITAEQAADPEYWANHTRQAVRFSDGLHVLGEEPNRLYLEVGPGKVLSGLARRHPDCQGPVVTSYPESGEAGRAEMLGALGRMWCHGVVPDWKVLHTEGTCGRIPLPTYPFERKSFWLGGKGQAEAPGGEGVEIRKPLADWFYLPAWKQGRRPRTADLAERLPADGRWLVLMDGQGFAEKLVQRLKSLDRTVVQVWEGKAFRKDDPIRYYLNPGNAEDYESLIEHLIEEGHAPDVVIHAFRIDEADTGLENLEGQLQRGYDSLAHLARACAKLGIEKPMRLGVLTNHMQRVAGEQAMCPEKAAMLGALWVLPKEFPNLSCKSIDLNPEPENAVLVDAVLAEMVADGGPEIVAYRGAMRWVETYDTLHLPEPEGQLPFRKQGVYLITHAFQEIGMTLAETLGKLTNARLVLVDRSFFPKPEEWDTWIRDQGEDDFISQNIARVRAIQEAGATVRVFAANPADLSRMQEVKAEAENELGAIHGVFHLEGPAPAGLIQGKTPNSISEILRSKIREALVLERLFHQLDFLVFFSQNPAEGGIGKSEQGAAHRFLNHLALQMNDGRNLPVVTVDWGTKQWWERDNELETAPPHIRQQLEEKSRLFGMSPADCVTALTRILTLDVPQVTVSTRDFQAVMDQQNLFTADFFQDRGPDEGGTVHPRPEISVAYEEPRDEVETLIADVWRTFFDIDKVGIKDNFFELGGHSLLAVQLLAKINETFAANLTLQVLFQAPTVAQLATLLTQEQGETEEADAMDALLAEIEGLSQEEIQAMLESEGK